MQQVVGVHLRRECTPYRDVYDACTVVRGAVHLRRSTQSSCHSPMSHHSSGHLSLTNVSSLIRTPVTHQCVTHQNTCHSLMCHSSGYLSFTNVSLIRTPVTRQPEEHLSLTNLSLTNLLLVRTPVTHQDTCHSPMCPRCPVCSSGELPSHLQQTFN